ncbi:hypothetical protein HAX54_022407, partial [Datura stramonium]|nr:hypothetical protein [Datura stramonium]
RRESLPKISAKEHTCSLSVALYDLSIKETCGQLGHKGSQESLISKYCRIGVEKDEIEGSRQRMGKGIAAAYMTCKAGSAPSETPHRSPSTWSP